MNITFNVTNTISSEIELKVDHETVQSQFVGKDCQAEFSLNDLTIKSAKYITLENSDMVYDITASCKEKVDNYIKPIVKVDPHLGVTTNPQDTKHYVSLDSDKLTLEDDRFSFLRSE